MKMSKIYLKFNARAARTEKYFYKIILLLKQFESKTKSRSDCRE